MIVALVACQRDAPRASPAASASAPKPGGSTAVAARTAASAPARGAADDSEDALIKEAFPDWGGQHGHVATIAGRDAFEGEIQVAITPAFVLAVDDTHRVLVVTGAVADEMGVGHLTEGTLGAYWFARREGRWFVSHREDSIVRDGTFGHVGKVARFDLGAGHPAVTVYSENCEFGNCLGSLYVVELWPDKSSLAINGIQVVSRAGTTDGVCSRALAGGREAASAPEHVSPEDCFDIAGTWRIEPSAGSERPDFVVQFKGHELDDDPATNPAAVKTIDQALVFRYAAGKYTVASGNNPTRGI